MLPNFCLRSVKMAVVRHTSSFVFDSVYNSVLFYSFCVTIIKKHIFLLLLIK